ncbi:unnamed protein product [Cuscuta epithymum]|uniref:OB domain-containing protein n=1 Tax=Cuscuta epithymum TaxID=186058 RepID=A0AAV0D546_9ASTE|nr:unnamed protein product [Cuscuta epithymum]
MEQLLRGLCSAPLCIYHEFCSIKMIFFPISYIGSDFRVAATVTDDTGFVDVTLFTNDILEIVKHTSLQPSGELELAALDKEIANLSFVLGLRRIKQDDECLQRNAYGIFCLCKVPTPLVDSPDDLEDKTDESQQQTKRKLDFLQTAASVPSGETGSPSTHAELSVPQLKSKIQKHAATSPKLAQVTNKKKPATFPIIHVIALCCGFVVSAH